MSTNKKYKKGSYITEACIVLPFFIVCIISMALIVKAMSVIETAIFEQCMFLHKAEIHAPYYSFSPKGLNYRVTDYDYLFSEDGINDLIRLDSQILFNIENPLGINYAVKPEIRILSRGFTGNSNNSNPLDKYDFISQEPSVEVVIFPKYGTKYHRKNCRYVKQDYEGEEEKIEIQKYEAEIRGYSPCLICGGVDN